VYQEQTAPLQAYYHNELITIAGTDLLDQLTGAAFWGCDVFVHRCREYERMFGPPPA
jgi:hypothetical protein